MWTPGSQRSALFDEGDRPNVGEQNGRSRFSGYLVGAEVFGDPGVDDTPTPSSGRPAMAREPSASGGTSACRDFEAALPG
jgi:hypothetical protein